ncbi:MAG: autotransporter-associated beta strand repeat-containing protein [Thermoguttaceae bacterium]
MQARKFIAGLTFLAWFVGMTVAAWAANPKDPLRRFRNLNPLIWDGDAEKPWGGSGTWSSTDARWWSGKSYRVWRRDVLKPAIFGTTAGTVTLGSDILAHDLKFEVNGYYLTGHYPLILSKPQPTITVANRNDLATIKVKIEGDAGLYKAGNGALKLINTNDYTGPTMVTGGTLILDAGNLPDGVPVLVNSPIIVANATVSLRGNNHRNILGQGIAELQPGGVLSADASDSANSFNLSNITLSGGTLAGSGTPRSGYSHFLVHGVIASQGDQPSLISAGLSDDHPDAAVLAFNVAPGGRDLRAQLVVAGPIVDCEAVKNTVSVRKLGAGTVAFSAANTYTGETLVDAGTLLLDFDQSGAPANHIINDSTSLVTNGGNITVHGKSHAASRQAFRGIEVRRGDSCIEATAGVGGTVSLDLGRIARQAGSTVNFALPASGGISTAANHGKHQDGPTALLGGFATVDGNTWAVQDDRIASGKINGLNHYHDGFSAGADVDVPVGRSTPNGMTVNSLRFNQSGEAQVNVSGSLTIASGGILVNSAVGDHAVSIDADRLTSGNGQDLVVIQNNTKKPLTIASPIVGSIGVTKSGGGILMLAGHNTYRGDLIVNDGIIRLGDPHALGDDTAGIHLLGGTLDLNGQTISNGKYLSVDDGAKRARLLINMKQKHAATFTPSIIIATDNNLLAGGNGDLTLAGSIVSQEPGSGGGLKKIGSGRLILSAGNTYRGDTRIRDGILQLAHPMALAKSTLKYNDSNRKYSDKGILDFGDLTQATFGGLSGNRNLILTGSHGPVALTVGGNNTSTVYQGVLSGSGSLTKVGSGQLTLRGAKYKGMTTILAGVLNVDASPIFRDSSKVFLRHAGAAEVAETGPSPKLIHHLKEAGQSYAGIGCTILGGRLQTRGAIVDGITSGITDVEMWWTLPTEADKTQGVASDILHLEGIRNTGGATDVFVLQISYDPERLQRDFGQNEADAVARRQLYLAVSTGAGWVPAVNANLGGTPHWQADSVQASNLGTMLNNKLGWHGVDTQNHVVWAVVNGNNTFAAVVRPVGRYQDRRSGVVNGNDASAAVVRPVGRQDRHSGVMNDNDTSAAVVGTAPNAQEPPAIQRWVAFAVGFVFLMLLFVLFYRYKKQKTSPKVR